MDGMHKEITEEIEKDRKRLFKEINKDKKWIIGLIIVFILAIVYWEYIHFLNNRFIKDLKYDSIREWYYGREGDCGIKVIDKFSIVPESGIYAEVKLVNVAYPQVQGHVTIYLWIYQHHFEGFTYRINYSGIEAMEDEKGVFIGNRNMGGDMYVDENMNLIDTYKYSIVCQKEYKQFIIDNEEAITQLIDTANKYWDLGLCYNPDV